MIISDIVVLGNRELRRSGDTENIGWWSRQNTYNIYQLSSLSYMGMACDVPRHYNSNTKITEDTDQCTNIIMKKLWNIVRITRMWHRDMKWAEAVGKIDLLNAGDCHKPSICLKMQVREAQRKRNRMEVCLYMLYILWGKRREGLN